MPDLFLAFVAEVAALDPAGLRVQRVLHLEARVGTTVVTVEGLYLVAILSKRVRFLQLRGRCGAYTER